MSIVVIVVVAVAVAVGVCVGGCCAVMFSWLLSGCLLSLLVL